MPEYNGKKYESELQLKDAESIHIFEKEYEDESGENYTRKWISAKLLSDTKPDQIRKLFSGLIENNSDCIDCKYKTELEKETETVKVFNVVADEEVEKTQVIMTIWA